MLMKIGLISDTHGYMDDRIKEHLKDRDEIWHAGDFGRGVANPLEQIAPLKGVYGNIDEQAIRQEFPEHKRFQCEGFDVWMTHIGGYPGKYEKHIREDIKTNPPDIFICGHSHILKVMRDKQLGLLHINPGAAGQTGFHKKRTLILMELENKSFKDLKVVELGKRGKVNN